MKSVRVRKGETREGRAAWVIVVSSQRGYEFLHVRPFSLRFWWTALRSVFQGLRAF